MIIAGHGQIAEMTLPSGWVEGQRKEGPAARLLRQYHPPDSSDVKLCFFYRGGPASDNSAEAFSRIIQEPEHTLSEIESDQLADVLGSISYPGAYQISSIETRDLNGKRVLIVEGEWTLNKHKSHEVFVDADGSGRFVQQIYFIAPENEYGNYWAEANKSLNSVQWI